MRPPGPGRLIECGALVVEPALVGSPGRGLRGFAGPAIGCELQAAAVHGIRDHAQTTPRLEVGGLLVGEVYAAEDGGFLVDVTDTLPARRAISDSHQLRFGLAAWLDLIQGRRQRQRGRVVGWYHTHPGFGVFLSAADRDLHSLFFCGLPWYVAVVFDPASGGLGVFAWDRDALVQLTAADREAPHRDQESHT